MELHSMKRTKAEKKSTSPEVATPYEGDDYPYGLEISLEKESLAKLGLDIDDFVVGGEVEIICHAEVTRTGTPRILRHDGPWERGVEKRGEQSGEQKGAIH